MIKQLVERLAAVSIIGVDIGSAAIKLVELERADGQVRLRRWALGALDGQDVSGALARAVREAGMARSFAALGLASPGLITKAFEFPPMPRKELRNAILLEAEQSVLNGHELSEMAIDWSILSQRPEAVRGVLAVVPKAALEARLRLVRAAGLRPTVVDVEGLALWNAYWTLEGARGPAGRTVLLVNVGAKATNLVIAKGPDALLLVRDIQLGAGALRQGRAEEWRDEVQDSLDYARAQLSLRGLDAARVSGGGGGADVAALLQRVVGAPVTLWNPLASLTVDSRCAAADEATGRSLAVAVGLALRA